MTSPSQLGLDRPLLPGNPDRDSIATDTESLREGQQEWKPQRQEYMVMLTLATISLVVALDATILVSVLPV